MKPSPGALRIIDDLEGGLAIVCNGNTAPKNILAGQYLFIKNHSTLPTGGYHATAAISSGGTISSSNVAADTDGIANTLNSKFAADTMTVHTNKIATLAKSGRVVNAFIPGISSVSMTSWQSIVVGTIPTGFEAISNSVYTVLPIQLGTTYIPVFYRVDGNKIYLENQSGNAVTTGTIMAMMLTWISAS